MLDPTIMYATIASTGNVLAALAHLLLLVLLLLEAWQTRAGWGLRLQP